MSIMLKDRISQTDLVLLHTFFNTNAVGAARRAAVATGGWLAYANLLVPRPGPRLGQQRGARELAEAVGAGCPASGDRKSVV